VIALGKHEFWMVDCIEHGIFFTLQSTDPDPGCRGFRKGADWVLLRTSSCWLVSDARES